MLLYHFPGKSLQILPLPFSESSSFCPSSGIIISVHKPYMYPIVIWFGEQKWQISLKSAQVDYPLISKAHALRVPRNCRLWLRGQECPAYPRSEEQGRSASTMPSCLLKVRLTPAFPPCASSHCVVSDWCWLGSPKLMQGITAQCAGG